MYIGDDYHMDILPAQKLRMFTILYDKGPTGMHGFPKRTKIKSPRVESMNAIPRLLHQHDKK